MPSDVVKRGFTPRRCSESAEMIGPSALAESEARPSPEAVRGAEPRRLIRRTRIVISPDNLMRIRLVQENDGRETSCLPWTCGYARAVVLSAIDNAADVR